MKTWGQGYLGAWKSAVLETLFLTPYVHFVIVCYFPRSPLTVCNFFILVSTSCGRYHSLAPGRDTISESLTCGITSSSTLMVGGVNDVILTLV